jgi:MFS family permease
VVAVVSGPAGKLAGRFGFRRILLAGFVVFASGLVWYAARVGLHPDYVSVWLPGTLVVGLGIGLTFPVLSAAAVSSLHHERFAVGSAVNQTARQVGGAIGVALLVVILGTPRSAMEALDNFHHLWIYAATMAVLSGLASSRLRPLGAERAEGLEPTEVPNPRLDLKPTTSLARRAPVRAVGAVEQSA